jgi:excinuclease ABC subunit C
VAARKGAAVKSLFNSQAFAGFGLSRLGGSGQLPPLTVVRGSRPGRLRAKVREQGPRGPGVYGMIDDRGELIYVGKAKQLRSRLLSYFRPNSRDPKAGRILARTRALAWEEQPSEFAALLRELELIRRWQPCFNVQGQPARRRCVYVCVGRRPAPYVFLSSKPPATALALFGPIPAGEKAREAVRRVNDRFGLRDCPQAQEMVFAGQPELFPVLRSPGCLRHEIGHCLAPCAAACTRGDYHAAVGAALEFLRGNDRGPLEALQREMTEAAAALAFERAGALRDKLLLLTWLSEHLDRLRQAAQLSFVYPVSGAGGELWYLIHGGQVRAVLPRPVETEAGRQAARLLEGVYRAEDSRPGPLTRDEIDGVLLVAGWFRKHPAERQCTLEPQAALALCGG